MKKVYLIRHAQPDFPGGSKMCLGVTDIPIGNIGREQARQMADDLPAVTAVFSSPMQRAVQTAQAIGLPFTVLSGLREMYLGDWDGLTFDQIRQQYPELYAARALDKTLPIPGQEDQSAAALRFYSAMNSAAEVSSGDFAVVTHGGIIAAFLEAIGTTWYKPGYTEILCLFWKDGVFYAKDPCSS